MRYGVSTCKKQRLHKERLTIEVNKKVSSPLVLNPKGLFVVSISITRLFYHRTFSNFIYLNFAELIPKSPNNSVNHFV